MFLKEGSIFLAPFPSPHGSLGAIGRLVAEPPGGPGVPSSPIVWQLWGPNMEPLLNGAHSLHSVTGAGRMSAQLSSRLQDTCKQQQELEGSTPWDP